MSETKILVVDDDSTLSGHVKEFLQSKGFLVDTHGTIEAAWNAMLASSYDLILLDLELPDASGIDFCKLYRDSGGIAPILMMTGKTSLDDKEEGLESGADDYLTKPVSMRELHARIKSMLRRASTYVPAQDASTTELPKVGLLISDRYKLEEIIGSGGMAVIWLATDLMIERSVVIKVMHGNLIGQSDTTKRFLQESRMLAKIQHPNVVAVYDAGSLNDRLPYLVMEYVEGESLRNLLHQQKNFSATDSISIMQHICTGLDKVHSAGIIHRDIKPDNILVQIQNNFLKSVKLADFGIARLIESDERITKEGMVVGTLEYMSPEQIRGLPLDARSDIYALGILFFEILTGELPFKGQSTIAEHLEETPLLPSSTCNNIPSSEELDKIVGRCLEREPGNRFQSVSELKVALNLLP